MSNETLVEFEHWFVENYPPDCIISRPEWHAPKIYRAASYVMERENKRLKAINAELLALLRECADAINETIPEDFSRLSNVADQARAAIKKAT